MSLKRVRFPHVDLFTIADGFTDIDAIREGLEAEITANRERRVLREKEHAQQGRLKEVRNEWDGMHTRALPVPVLPNLQEFRKLSVVKIYEQIWGTNELLVSFGKCSFSLLSLILSVSKPGVLTISLL